MSYSPVPGLVPPKILAIVTQGSAFGEVILVL
jgi:hypothetical protein